MLVPVNQGRAAVVTMVTCRPGRVKSVTGLRGHDRRSEGEEEEGGEEAEGDE